MRSVYDSLPIRVIYNYSTNRSTLGGWGSTAAFKTVYAGSIKIPTSVFDVLILCISVLFTTLSHRELLFDPRGNTSGERLEYAALGGKVRLLFVLFTITLCI